MLRKKIEARWIIDGKEPPHSLFPFLWLGNELEGVLVVKAK